MRVSEAVSQCSIMLRIKVHFTWNYSHTVKTFKSHARSRLNLHKSLQLRTSAIYPQSSSASLTPPDHLSASHTMSVKFKAKAHRKAPLIILLLSRPIVSTGQHQQVLSPPETLSSDATGIVVVISRAGGDACDAGSRIDRPAARTGGEQASTLRSHTRIQFGTSFPGGRDASTSRFTYSRRSRHPPNKTYPVC